jgi:hypothetical protein
MYIYQYYLILNGGRMHVRSSQDRREDQEHTIVRRQVANRPRRVASSSLRVDVDSTQVSALPDIPHLRNAPFFLDFSLCLPHPVLVKGSFSVLS